MSLIGMLSVASCSVYHPELTNIPLMTHRGETQVTVGVQEDVFLLPQLNVDAAYAFADHFAVQGYVGMSSTEFFNTRLAVGYYLPLAHQAVAEVYVGGGYGRSDYQRQKTGDWYLMGYEPVFAQVNFGWTDLLPVHLDVGASCKVGAFAFDGTDNYNSEPKAVNGTYGMVEPQLFVRLGGSRVKFQIQGGYNWFWDPKSEAGKALAFTFCPLAVGVGVNFRF